ncbi:MAG: hypothetical protein IBX47_04920 [Desulfuromonadales bacterium]|nr:hypothetical protein [Desulfuromonadales bacterium]
MLLASLFLVVTPVFAATEIKLPQPLKPWVDWVLYDHAEALLCTPNFNDADLIRCNWPTALDLEIESRGGLFRQKWLLEHESWIQLPGDEKNWPEEVAINGKPAIILSQQGVPKVKLPPGEYQISGAFTWQSLPEFLQIAPPTALLSLKVSGKAIDFPSLDDSGRVWLQNDKQTEKVIEERLQIQAFRLIDDRIPARIVLQLNLDVAGSAREVLLAPPFPMENFIPVALVSSLPARLEKDGRIRLQLRPGQWQIRLTARHIGPLTSLTFIRPNDDFWPEQEIWVFAKQNNRIVEIEGGSPIDPQQTSLPHEWRNLPAYRLLADEVMKFNLIKRGDPDPAPDQLSLQRNFWLRFDGSGYTLQDHISGKKTSDWRLEMAPPIALGRVAVDDREQFITKMADAINAGVELRSGLVEILADSEYQGSISRLPATGWDHDFQKVSARLFLPPGYRLLHATGIDNIPATWLNSWTLLDIFILLIFTISLAKLYSRPMAVIGFITMALLYHEPDAPRWVWLAILLGVALIRTLPDGRFLKAVKLYQLAAFFILIIIAIPFSIKQLRVGIYPQLEKPWQAMSRYQPAAPATLAERPQPVESTVEMEMQSVDAIARLEQMSVPSRKSKIFADDHYSSAVKAKPIAQYDPSMINQTGPGIPAWQWNSVEMGWSGPVKRNQQIGLTLIGPKINLALAFARVALMILLALGIIGVKWKSGKRFNFPDPKKFLPILLLLVPLLMPTHGRAAEIPSSELFEELRQRLLEKEDCFPNCADIPVMSIAITPSLLEIEFKVEAQTKVAIPLPGNPKHWLASRVKIDTRPATALYRTSEGLWLLIPAGSHSVHMQSSILSNGPLQLTLPLKPHKLQLKQTGWIAAGINPDGSIDNQLQFKRIAREEKESSRILETGILPAFVLIERSLQLGLDWRVTTRISRISPTGSAVILDYPLLPGEAVLTAGINVKEGKARINLDPQSHDLIFESVLEKSAQISLNHAETDDWTETWQVDASPIFHLEYAGIPVILHQSGNRWAPKWHPWPGESLQLKISRPDGVAGQTVTIDKSQLEIRPGQRVTDTQLELSLQSSQGGQQTITLPPESALQEVQIDGQIQSIRQEGRSVPLPISPGRQQITLKWREAGGITANYKTPEIHLGLVNANTNIDLHLPTNRWPLLVYGPVIGPAILFWSVLLIIIVAAFGLAKSRLTHLKFYQLLLLGIGMSQSHLIGIVLVVGWLIALDYRQKIKPDMAQQQFNLMQLSLGGLTLLALLALVFAISQGLLGHPDMNIVGNGSSRNLLRWYQDYNNGELPRAGLLSVPLLWYRLAMLAWALWLSFTLTGILRYGWQVFSKPILWHPIDKKMKKPGFKKTKRDQNKETDLTFEMEVEDKDADKE